MPEVAPSESKRRSSSDPVPKRGPAYPRAVDRLIEEFAALPGVGRRSAERLAFHVLKGDTKAAEALANAVLDVKRTVKNCRVCWNLADADSCEICRDPARDRRTVLIVEQPRDLIALEQTAMYRGLYHVLMGRLSPLDGIGPDELTIHDLLKRLDDPVVNPGHTPITELILGLNPTLEGDGTALYLSDIARGRGVKVTRLARGLPTGSSLEFANKAVLADAIEGRQSVT